MMQNSSTDHDPPEATTVALTPFAEFWHALNSELKNNSLPGLRYGQAMPLWERVLDDAGMLAAENIGAAR